MIAKFLISATDRATGATIYAVKRDGKALTFRAGLGIAGAPGREIGLNTNPVAATRYTIEEAGAAIESLIRTMGQGAWFKEPRIEFAGYVHAGRETRTAVFG